MFLIMNTFFLMSCGNKNDKLCGIWKDSNKYIIINDDSTFVWIEFADSDDENIENNYIRNVKYGDVKDNTLLPSKWYDVDYNGDYSKLQKSILYYKLDDIPDERIYDFSSTKAYVINMNSDYEFGLYNSGTTYNYSFSKQADDYKIPFEELEPMDVSN